MSRISAVRSTTLTLTLSSRFLSWPGLSSPSQITVSAPLLLTISFNSATGVNTETNEITIIGNTLQTGDKIKFNVFPSSSNTIKLRYDTNIRKITTDLIDFDSEVGVNTATNEITITGNSLKTGDKVVYYSNGNTSVGGLVDNQVYYILKQNPEFVNNINYQPELKYYSVDTNTIYPPALQFSWRDFTWATSSNISTLTTLPAGFFT